MSSVILHVLMDVPDHALQRLTNMNLTAIRQAANATVVEVSWDGIRQEWKVVTRLEGHGQSSTSDQGMPR